jgi:protein-glucosylgalactosylhydroxylysine glucosidase
MPAQKNTYLVNGHNYQDKRLRLYLPGNGGLLAAVALMAAGWDNNSRSNPGFPKNGKWNVRWEGLQRMP